MGWIEENKKGRRPKRNPYLCKKQIELLPWSMVSTLREKEFNLLLDLFFIQVPTVFIIYASTCCWVRSTYKQQRKNHYGLNKDYRFMVGGEGEGGQKYRGIFWTWDLSCFGYCGFTLLKYFEVFSQYPNHSEGRGERGSK